MNVIVSRLDMRATKTNWPADIPFAPALIQAKQPGQPEEWIVIDAKIEAANAISFADTSHDQYLRIPLFEYLLNPEADLALAFMAQIGLMLVGFTEKPIKTLHVVTGNPVDLMYEGDTNTALGLRYWFGFAFSTER